MNERRVLKEACVGPAGGAEQPLRAAERDRLSHSQVWTLSCRQKEPWKAYKQDSDLT